MFQSPKFTTQSCRFPAGGPDGLHLKDLIGPSGVGAADNLVRSSAAFTALVLSGDFLVSIRTFFFGTNMTTLQKN